MQIKRSGVLGVVVALGIMVGCAGAEKKGNDVSSLDDGEAIVVGRVVLDPPRGANEPAVGSGGRVVIPKGIRNMLKEVYIMNGAVPFEGDEPQKKKDYTRFVRTHFNELFFYRINNKSPYLTTLQYTISYHSSTGGGGTHVTMTRDWQKGNMNFNAHVVVKPGDQVIYLGTLKFHRDEFNHFKGLSVTDNLAAEMSSIKEELGTSVKVRKALIHSK